VTKRKQRCTCHNRNTKIVQRHPTRQSCQIYQFVITTSNAKEEHRRFENVREHRRTTGFPQTIDVSLLSASACLARYCSRLIFICKLSGTSGTLQSIMRPMKKTTCCEASERKGLDLVVLSCPETITNAFAIAFRSAHSFILGHCTGTTALNWM